MNIPLPLRELAQWDNLSSEQRREIANGIAKALPAPWQLLRLETHSLGGVTHEIAFFDYNSVVFALLPGEQEAILGYDPTIPWVPPQELVEDIRVTEEGWGDGPLDGSMAPLRRVLIAPFLIEVEPTQATWVEERDEEDSVEAADIAATYRKGFFRLPTEDEWEYACAAGTRTRWRWGDTIPPVEIYKVKDWNEHTKPNAFGLTINADPYWTELCDGGEVRAGDGGTSICGGYGIVASWIPLASAFYESCFDMAPTEYGEQMKVRRVWCLDSPSFVRDGLRRVYTKARRNPLFTV